MNYFIKEADDAIGYLWEQLEQRELDSHAHVVVVSRFKKKKEMVSGLLKLFDIGERSWYGRNRTI
jgi:predicted AlkP superfamily pyrophosphatase or phosphodiesterase